VQEQNRRTPPPRSPPAASGVPEVTVSRGAGTPEVTPSRGAAARGGGGGGGSMAAAAATGGPQGLRGWLRSAYRFATDRNDFRRSVPLPGAEGGKARSRR